MVCMHGSPSQAYERTQLSRVSENKDKQHLSADLPAAPVIDVNGNNQTTAEELLTHERRTAWLVLSFAGQINNKTSVDLNPDLL